MNEPSHPRYISKKNENISPHKNLYRTLTVAIIYDIHKLEITHVSSNNEWINKMYLYNGLYVAIKRNYVLLHGTI